MLSDGFDLRRKSKEFQCSESRLAFIAFTLNFRQVTVVLSLGHCLPTAFVRVTEEKGRGTSPKSGPDLGWSELLSRRV